MALQNECIPAGAVLYAKTLSRVSNFYRHVLDASVHVASPDHVTLDCSAMRLVIHAIPAAIADTITIQDPPVRREDAAIKLSFPVRSVERARLIALEYGGVLDPAERTWIMDGRRYCDGQDPEGNVFQLHDADPAISE